MSTGTVDQAKRRDDRAGLGQVFTPQPIAQLLASKFDFSGKEPLRILDPGAGLGALSEAVVTRLRRFKRVGALTMIETDELLAAHLNDVADEWPNPHSLSIAVVHADFLEVALRPRADGDFGYSHVVMNPPYMRIGSGSQTRKILSEAGVEANNMYAAFLWLGLDLLSPNGQLVAIVPRSFFNGPQFRALRQRILRDCRLVSIHTFDKRSVFSRDRVLQETVIVRIDKSKAGRSVTISASPSDGSGTGTNLRVAESSVLPPNDPDTRFRVPSGPSRTIPAEYKALFDDQLQVKTGSIVDFRFVQDISTAESERVVPLLGSEEFAAPTSRVPRYLKINDRTTPHIFPAGNYIVIKRVSPREQQPRLKARLVEAARLSGYGGVAFENHVNVIHLNGGGIPIKLARSILRSIQSVEAQTQFEELSGTTQVNVSDLMALRFPVS